MVFLKCHDPGFPPYIHIAQGLYTLSVAPPSFHTSPHLPPLPPSLPLHRVGKLDRHSWYESAGNGSFGSATLGEWGQDHGTGAGLTKHYVLPIQPVTLRTGDEELAAICTGTTVCLTETKYSCSEFSWPHWLKSKIPQRACGPDSPTLSAKLSTHYEPGPELGPKDTE